MEDYCRTALGWLSDYAWLEDLKKTHKLSDESQWGQIIYILYKTGYIFEAENEYFNERKSEILAEHGSDTIRTEIRTLDQMLNFLRDHVQSQLLSDYFDSCENRKEAQQSALNYWNSTNRTKRNASLNTHIGQTKFFQHTFQGAPDKAFLRLSNSGTWTSYDIKKAEREDQFNYCISL